MSSAITTSIQQAYNVSIVSLVSLVINSRTTVDLATTGIGAESQYSLSIRSCHRGDTVPRLEGLIFKAKGVEVDLKMLRRLARQRALSISKGPDEDRIEGLARISRADLEILIMEPASALLKIFSGQRLTSQAQALAFFDRLALDRLSVDQRP